MHVWSDSKPIGFNPTKEQHKLLKKIIPTIKQLMLWYGVVTLSGEVILRCKETLWSEVPLRGAGTLGNSMNCRALVTFWSEVTLRGMVSLRGAGTL